MSEFAEVTEMSGLTPEARRLIRLAFEERLGAVDMEFDFHRNWNGGWRCRVVVVGRGTLEFALLTSPEGALLALPVPVPGGWKARGVADSAGGRWTTNADGDIVSLGIEPAPG